MNSNEGGFKIVWVGFVVVYNELDNEFIRETRGWVWSYWLWIWGLSPPTPTSVEQCHNVISNGGFRVGGTEARL